MLQGEYIIRLPSGDEQVIPNNFTIFGIQAVLRAAFWQQPSALQLGLCSRNPGDVLRLGNMAEPDATNGYARQNVPMDIVNWPKLSSINGESFIESREVTFALTGEISSPVNRLFLTDGTEVISVSSAFEAGLQFLDTPLITRYRLYFR